MSVADRADVRADVRGLATRSSRVSELVGQMTLEEKLAQLVGLWIGVGGSDSVAPMQDAMQADQQSFETFAADGLGQLTRPFGTAPVEPEFGRALLARRQRWLMSNTRLGIPAIAHEECLTGVAAWQATTYPSPPAWGSTFDPQLVEAMGAQIGESLHSLGIHQGLAPVLDVVRDARWGRVEECIAEDPYVVGVLGTAYVAGVQSAGIIATLKHFVGYSNSRAGRNLAPVHAGPREIADVLLFPFEMAIMDGGVQSVMNSYAEIDGVPVAADSALLTGLLREKWGFDGTVVADYFSVAFLERLHRVAGSPADAAMQALTAGIDVELPTGDAFPALSDAVRRGDIGVGLVDRALIRVLEQKAQLGLLDEAYQPEVSGPVDLNPPASRAIAGQLAEESVILLHNDGRLPLASPRRVAVIGPNANDRLGLFGCYAFANHVLPQHPGVELGIEAPTILEALRGEFAGAHLEYVEGCDIDGDDVSRISEAVAVARASDVAVVVVGDRAGLFGRGTSGEGCDAADLELPGVQRRLVEAIADAGVPVVLVLLTGRPYAIGWAVPRTAAILQVFFPGQEGAAAIAGVLSGRVNPSGRLPMSMPHDAGSAPYSYLHPPLGADNDVSNVDTTPVYPFGHGLSYTVFEYEELRLDDRSIPTDGAIAASVTVRNSGSVAGDEIVQLYAADPVAGVTRPLVQLVGFARVRLEPGETVDVAFDVPARLLAFSGRDLVQRVEPGRIDVSLGRSSAELIQTVSVELIGEPHAVRREDRRVTGVCITPGDSFEERERQRA